VTHAKNAISFPRQDNILVQTRRASEIAKFTSKKKNLCQKDYTLTGKQRVCLTFSR